MIAEIWNDINDWSVDDLFREGNEHCKAFSEFFLKKAEQFEKTEEKIGINQDSIKRYYNLCSFFFSTIKEKYSENENNDLSPQIVCWTLLGSIIETTLQMFLAFYKPDYFKSEWLQWKEFRKEDVTERITQCFDQMESEGLLLEVHKKKLVKAMKEKIRQHTKTPIHQVMLDDLINFYTSKDKDGNYIIWEKDESETSEYSHLRKIQGYRNGIHSFQDRDIGNWEELFTETKFLCYIQEWIMQRMPIENVFEVLNKFLNECPEIADKVFFCCEIEEE